MKITKTNTKKFENADVIITDPCYIFDFNTPELEKAWQEFSSMLFDEKGNGLYPKGGTLEYNGAFLLFTDTAYGDGIYSASCKSETADNIGVDSGMICVLTLEDALKINPAFKIITLGHTFKNVTGVVSVKNYCFTGVIECNTKEEDNDGWLDDNEFSIEFDQDEF